MEGLFWGRFDVRKLVRLGLWVDWFEVFEDSVFEIVFFGELQTLFIFYSSLVSAILLILSI
jgi:hypothetical protein